MPNIRIQSITDVSNTLLMANCSLQAYNADNPGTIQVPKGYSFKGTWSGVDDVFEVFNEGSNFGVIFQSNSDPCEYIFAFRGTDDFFDILKDIDFDTTFFTAYNDDNLAKLNVHYGFNSVYHASDRFTTSMQLQLFEWLNKLKPTTLWITGHSLGAALSELFLLDILVSTPNVYKSGLNIYSCNFACPRVGLVDFSTFYDSRSEQQNKATQTVRIVNYYDWVPYMPPAMCGYDHVGVYFLIAFAEKNCWFPHPLVNHHMQNYLNVLEKVLAAPDQIYVGDVTGSNGMILQSYDPINDMSLIKPHKDVLATQQMVTQ